MRLVRPRAPVIGGQAFAATVATRQPSLGDPVLFLEFLQARANRGASKIQTPARDANGSIADTDRQGRI